LEKKKESPFTAFVFFENLGLTANDHIFQFSHSPTFGQTKESGKENFCTLPFLLTTFFEDDTKLAISEAGKVSRISDTKFLSGNSLHCRPPNSKMSASLINLPNLISTHLIYTNRRKENNLT
jgi:hypothetical protein